MRTTIGRRQMGISFSFKSCALSTISAILLELWAFTLGVSLLIFLNFFTILRWHRNAMVWSRCWSHQTCSRHHPSNHMLLAAHMPLADHTLLADHMLLAAKRRSRPCLRPSQHLLLDRRPNHRLRLSLQHHLSLLSCQPCRPYLRACHPCLLCSRQISSLVAGLR